MSAALIQHIGELTQDADVFLYRLWNYRDENPSEEFRFSNLSGVSFNGPYTPIACNHDNIEISSQGVQNQPQLTIADTASSVTSLIDSVNGIEGADLEIIRTKARFLDSGSTPDTTAILQRARFVVGRMIQYIPLDAVIVELLNPITKGYIALPGR